MAINVRASAHRARWLPGAKRKVLARLAGEVRSRRGSGRPVGFEVAWLLYAVTRRRARPPTLTGAWYSPPPGGSVAQQRRDLVVGLKLIGLDHEDVGRLADRAFYCLLDLRIAGAG